MVMIADMVEQDAQFIIATHSAILRAFPGATIYSFDRMPVEEVEYDTLDHVVLTREFLNAPERYLRALRTARGAERAPFAPEVPSLSARALPLRPVSRHPRRASPGSTRW